MGTGYAQLGQHQYTRLFLASVGTESMQKPA